MPEAIVPRVLRLPGQRGTRGRRMRRRGAVAVDPADGRDPVLRLRGLRDLRPQRRGWSTRGPPRSVAAAPNPHKCGTRYRFCGRAPYTLAFEISPESFARISIASNSRNAVPLQGDCEPRDCGAWIEGWCGPLIHDEIDGGKTIGISVANR